MLEIRGGSGWEGRSLQLLKELCHKARDVSKSLQPDTGHLLGNGPPSLCCFQEYPDALVLAAGKSGCNLDVLAPGHPGAFENLKHGNST